MRRPTKPLLWGQGRAKPPPLPPSTPPHCAQAWDSATASCPRGPGHTELVQSYPNLEGLEGQRGVGWGDEGPSYKRSWCVAGVCSVVEAIPLLRTRCHENPEAAFHHLSSLGLAPLPFHCGLPGQSRPCFGGSC